ncbi:MAG: hypothetical protein CMB80_27720 [Flammeovirgaceae bacterium]|nr:hypothetical protein [Flammeovirgaceae bacterium]
MKKRSDRVVGLYNRHDGGYCVLEDGIVREHIEIERYTRLKEDGGDSLQYLKDGYLSKNSLTIADVDAWVAPCPDTSLESGVNKKYDTHQHIAKSDIHFYSHHLCHASHAFFSSNFDDSYVFTIDSAGMEDDGRSVSTCGYIASGNDIRKIFDIPNDAFSLGNLWGRMTRFVFKLSAGYPRGHQAGSVMAMAALGDPNKYYDDVLKLATTHFQSVKQAPPGYKRGIYVPPEEDVIHPTLYPYKKIAEDDEKEKFNLAASLQKVSEDLTFDLIKQFILLASDAGFTSKNICFAGGVSLNSVMMGKILKNFPQLTNCFIPPVPYDGGLSIGASQYHWYSVLRKPRKKVYVSPYLGEKYSLKHVEEAIDRKILDVSRNITLQDCVNLLIDQKIVSVFSGRSESGRRALGNRSILADPRSPLMKDTINEKVKHRQWYRPFAPTILEEQGSDWFEGFFPSPYMGFVFKFKKDKLGLTPAVEHFDKTARVQSVSREQNSYYHELIDLFFKETGIPLLLNTSFNDREPICETPQHAVDCFLGTDIDYLYFAEHQILVSKKSSKSIDK